MPDDPHFIPPAERADGEPGEGGCLRAEAEEREAEQSAPDLLRHYRAIINPPPDQPYPSQALADMIARGEYPHGLRAPLKANFDQACRRGGWEAFGFPVDQGRRVRASAHQTVLRHLGERREVSNLDRRFGLSPRRHR